MRITLSKVDNSEIEIRELQGSTLIPALNLNSIESDKTSNCTSYPFFLSFFRTCHLPRCQIGALAGLLSTSHFRLTDIPSTIGIPKPGKRVIANDGVSETGIKQLVSIPQRQCALARFGALLCCLTEALKRVARVLPLHRGKLDYYRHDVFWYIRDIPLGRSEIAKWQYCTKSGVSRRVNQIQLNSFYNIFVANIRFRRVQSPHSEYGVFLQLTSLMKLTE